MLIKLTGVPHPDLNGGKAQSVYIDASRVLLICQSHVEHPKIGSVEEQRDLHVRIWEAAMTLSQKVCAYVPDMTDPVAVGWMKTATAASHAVNSASNAIQHVSGRSALHPSVDCTEVQLACGTALEHGVMLTRVWVSESPEEVANKIYNMRDPLGILPRA